MILDCCMFYVQMGVKAPPLLMAEWRRHHLNMKSLIKSRKIIKYVIHSRTIECKCHLIGRLPANKCVKQNSRITCQSCGKVEQTTLTIREKTIACINYGLLQPKACQIFRKYFPSKITNTKDHNPPLAIWWKGLLSLPLENQKPKIDRK